jgi:hypothetical protein
MYFIDIMPSYCGIELLLIGSAMTLIVCWQSCDVLFFNWFLLRHVIGCNSIVKFLILLSALLGFY